MICRAQRARLPSSQGLHNQRAAAGDLPSAARTAGRRASTGSRLHLVGGHDPQLADGGMAGPGDHVGDAVGDVLGARTSVSS
jgi:hypothetical protein